MLKPLLITIVLTASCSVASYAQSDATASRIGDLQLGLGYSSASSDYVPNRIGGFALYGDFDFRSNIGVEVDFHQVKDSKGTEVYERTYEVGARYFRYYGRFKPYAKLMVGRGVFNYPKSEANLAYNMVALGGGVDVAVHRRINVRADFEYQDWFGFKPNGLTPTVLTIGVAYHFPPGPLALGR